jgi:hypothetical protein
VRRAVSVPGVDLGEALHHAADLFAEGFREHSRLRYFYILSHVRIITRPAFACR